MDKLTVLFTVVRFFSCFIVISTNPISNCTQTDSTSGLLVCSNGTVPDTVPDNVNHVILNGVNLDYFDGGQFNHSSWLNVVRLEIDAPSGLIIKSDTFLGLYNLYYLKMKGTELSYLQNDSFRRLPNVEKLDLSDNFRLGLDDITFTLQDDVRYTLPSLRWLNLARLQTFYTTPIEFSVEKDTFGILGRRKIEYLDLTGCTISPIDVNEMEKMCSSLKRLILRETIITNPILDKVYVCGSLKEVDLSHSQSIDFSVIKFMALIPFIELWLQKVLTPFLNVENVLISHLKTDVKTDFQETVRFSNIPLRFKKIDLSFNRIRIFNGSVLLHPVTAASIREINFSNNMIQYISPNILGASFHNEILNLSQNSLCEMALHYNHDFKLLLSSVTHLRILDLSGNRLKSLPWNFFRNNNQLLEIHLSENSLQNIDFKLNHLTKLRFLDLHGNKMKALEWKVILQLQQIGRFQSLQNGGNNGTKEGNISSPNVLLHRNPMECNCDKGIIKSLQWIVRAGYIVLTDTLICTFHEKSLHISNAALTEVVHQCYVIQLRKTLLKCGLSTAFVISACLIIAMFTRRYINKRNSLKTFVNMIKSNNKLKYLIFLSFCNEDGDLVLENIYPRMRDEVSRALDCDRNLVCCGELDFRPGMSVCLEVMRCMEQSAVVIFVVSKTFCQKSWCKMEVDTANAQRKPVILLFLEKVEPELMSPYIQKLFNRYSRASWNGSKDGGELHPPWPVLISSVIELGSTFYAENRQSKGSEKIDLSSKEVIENSTSFI